VFRYIDIVRNKMKKCSERDANTARCSARVTHTHTVQFSQSISQSMVYFILQSKAVLRYIYNGKKKRSERRKHCALAVVRRSQKFSTRRRPSSGGTGRPKLISWRWSLPSPADPV